MSTEELVLASVLMTFAAAVHGSVGFGANLLIGPLLASISPDFVPAPIVLTGVVINLVVMWREPKVPDDIDRRPWYQLRWALGGLVPGSVLGALTVAAIPKDDLSVMVAILVLVATGLVAAGVSVVRTNRTLFATGTASGYMSAAGGIGGAPIALVHADIEGAEFRRTMSRFLSASAALSIITLTAVGELGRTEVGIALALMPGVAVGLVASEWIRPRVDRGRVKPFVLAIIAASATLVLVRSVM
jgi:uncharacterized membrane protein YfcA